ncbi:54S ribosomal protein L40, mitochondrial [[Candida] anglica]|uniref:54S ribosomal protein L40, mitochondrial n=1 Tax=[Candida] anglica TaxID=148631 RepID=A0ABP0EJZ0_9ASCO
MSSRSVWHGFKRRFQHDLERVPLRNRQAMEKKMERFALPHQQMGAITVPVKDRKYSREEVGITRGDLVYVSEGPHKGKITQVIRYIPDYDSFMLMDVTSKKAIPKFQWAENQTTHLADFPEFVKSNQVKLAAKDKNEKGEIYYLVADEIEMKNKVYNDQYKKWLPQRFVKNYPNLEIPWPSPEKAPEDDPLSTSEQAAFTRTYELQTLARSPIPAEALSQLRNPYSKYKKRVLSEFQARKMKAPDMPLSDAQRAYLAAKAKQPKKVYESLSEEIQDFIGSKMADHINKIENPHLLAHLEDLSSVKIPDFEVTQEKIREGEASK